jgi:hypothetical protein
VSGRQAVSDNRRFQSYNGLIGSNRPSHTG